MKNVYLAGPITGQTFEGCTDWRQFAIKDLRRSGITGLSPLRGKEYLKKVGVLGDEYQDIPLSTARAITTRDRWDATRCDIILVNLLGATRVSIGTVMELAWADSCRIPSIVVIEPEGNLHDHSMLKEVMGFRVDTLEKGLHIAKAILTP